jgi:hypothetical protein
MGVGGGQGERSKTEEDEREKGWRNTKGWWLKEKAE